MRLRASWRDFTRVTCGFARGGCARVSAHEGELWKERINVYDVVMHRGQLLESLIDPIFLPEPGINKGLMSDGRWVLLCGDLFGLAAAPDAAVHVDEKAAVGWAHLV